MQADLLTEEIGLPGLPHTDPSAATDAVDVPVIDVAATARSGRETDCEHRAPPGSRIRGLQCRDQRAPKLSYGDFVSMPDGLKPAAVLLQR